MKLGCALCDSDQRIEHGRQLFIFYLDQLSGFFRDSALLGRHHRDFLADETRPVPRQHRHVAQPPTGQHTRDINRRQHNHDARMRFCP